MFCFVTLKKEGKGPNQVKSGKFLKKYKYFLRLETRLCKKIYDHQHLSLRPSFLKTKINEI